MRVWKLSGCPWGYDPNAIYVFQVLGKGRWITRGRGKPTLRNISRWRQIADEATQSFRMRIRLPNGQYFSAFCASQPYRWLVAVENYLIKEREKTKKIYYKVLKEDLTSVGLRGCKPIQYILNKWCFMNPPETLHFASQSKGGLNACKTKSGVRCLREYVKEKYGFETLVYECEIGKILYESKFKIETDKIRLIRNVTEVV